MNLYGIGIDVVEVGRIEEALQGQGERFRNKLFTQNEQEYCQRQANSALHYAARFAAKEAVAKALGTGIGKELGWLDMEITRKPSGEPSVVLSGNGKEFAQAQGISLIKVSLTHAKLYAAANAVAMSA